MSSLVLPASSALPFHAIEGRAVALHDAADAAAAVAARARLAFAPINRPLMLKISQLARGLHVIAKRRPAGGDRPLQHLADRQHQPPRALLRDGARQAPRRESGTIEHLRDV